MAEILRTPHIYHSTQSLSHSVWNSISFPECTVAERQEWSLVRAGYSVSPQKKSSLFHMNSSRPPLILEIGDISAGSWNRRLSPSPGALLRMPGGERVAQNCLPRGPAKQIPAPWLAPGSGNPPALTLSSRGAPEHEAIMGCESWNPATLPAGHSEASFFDTSKVLRAVWW